MVLSWLLAKFKPQVYSKTLRKILFSSIQAVIFFSITLINEMQKNE